jgi:hypothetical protein
MSTPIGIIIERDNQRVIQLSNEERATNGVSLRPIQDERHLQWGARKPRSATVIRKHSRKILNPNHLTLSGLSSRPLILGARSASTSLMQDSVLFEKITNPWRPALVKRAIVTDFFNTYPHLRGEYAFEYVDDRLCVEFFNHTPFSTRLLPGTLKCMRSLPFPPMPLQSNITVTDPYTHFNFFNIDHLHVNGPRGLGRIKASLYKWQCFMPRVNSPLVACPCKACLRGQFFAQNVLQASLRYLPYSFQTSSNDIMHVSKNVAFIYSGKIRTIPG